MCLILAFGLVFNAVQSNSIAEAMLNAFAIPKMATGAVVALGCTRHPSSDRPSVWRCFQARSVVRASASHCCTAGLAQAVSKATPAAPSGQDANPRTLAGGRLRVRELPCDP